MESQNSGTMIQLISCTMQNSDRIGAIVAEFTKSFFHEDTGGVLIILKTTHH
jgi:hypothetical protein